MSDEAIPEESGRIEQSRLIIPALAGFYRQAAPLGYAVLRVLLALMFIQAGVDKMFLGGAGRIATGNIVRLGLAPAEAWAWLVAITEFFGAILLGIGLFTRPAAFALAIELAVIAFAIMALRGVFWTTGGIEVALLMMLMAIGFVFGGGGRYSLDRLIGREF
jgi:putative oxidoreductase